VKSLKNSLKKIIEVGAQIQVTLGAFCLALVIITITTGIISRYVFNSPFAWTEELGVFLFVWIAFLGAAVAVAKNKHVAIDLLPQKLSPKTAVVLEFILNIFILVFLIVMIFGAFKLYGATGRHFSVALNIPRSIYYLAPLTSGIYMALVYIYRNLELLEKGSTAVQHGSRSAEL
jgi:TRAP-type C4-dicarboxylate transport system permease small subunit